MVPQHLCESIFALKQWPLVEGFDDLFARGGSPHFIVQDSALLRQGGGYDALIARDNLVPTRPYNWHDFFNALAWSCFPRTKSALHQIQWREHQKDSSRDGRNGRTLLQNALTAFDESGLLVVSSSREVLEQIRELKWRQCFWDFRSHTEAHTRWISLGHSTLEGLLSPHRGLTAKALLLHVPAALLHGDCLLEELDQFLSENILGLIENTASLTPVPVLGIPDWAQAQSREFYADEGYFRTQRRRKVPLVPIHAFAISR